MKRQPSAISTNLPPGARTPDIPSPMHTWDPYLNPSAQTSNASGSSASRSGHGYDWDYDEPYTPYAETGTRTGASHLHPNSQSLSAHLPSHNRPQPLSKTPQPQPRLPPRPPVSTRPTRSASTSSPTTGSGSGSFNASSISYSSSYSPTQSTFTEASYAFPEPHPGRSPAYAQSLINLRQHRPSKSEAPALPPRRESLEFSIDVSIMGVLGCWEGTLADHRSSIDVVCSIESTSDALYHLDDLEPFRGTFQPLVCPPSLLSSPHFISLLLSSLFFLSLLTIFPLPHQFGLLRKPAQIPDWPPPLQGRGVARPRSRCRTGGPGQARGREAERAVRDIQGREGLRRRSGVGARGEDEFSFGCVLLDLVSVMFLCDDFDFDHDHLRNSTVLPSGRAHPKHHQLPSCRTAFRFHLPSPTTRVSV
jgi:hypothetical protein